MFSVIMPSFNNARFLEAAIASVVQQTYPHWELIVVDDASTDGSPEIIRAYSRKYPNIQSVFLEENGGVIAARNLGLERANGRYLTFLDSDDLWSPHFLETMKGFMESTGQPFCFASYFRMHENGRVFDTFIVPEKVDYLGLLKTCSIGYLTAVYDSHYLGKMVLPNYPLREDYGLWLQLLKKTPYAHGCKEPLAYYRIHKNSSSFNKFKMARYQWAVYRRYEKLPLLRSIFYMLCYCILGIFKHRKRLLGMS